MSVIERIERVLAADLLTRELIVVPSRGATDDEIRNEEALLGDKLCSDHTTLLSRWNGISLEVIRLYGCGSGSLQVGRLSQLQLRIEVPLQGTIIGSDPSGFAYLQSPDGRVFSIDTDGGAVELLAADLDDFIERLVFGPDAASFAGNDWLAELRDAGIVQ